MSSQHQYDIKINGDNRSATVCEVEGTIIYHIQGRIKGEGAGGVLKFVYVQSPVSYTIP